MIRKTLFLMLCVMVSATVHAAHRKGASIECVTTEFDMGELSRNTGVKYFTFEFTNNGSQPVVVLSARTSCSCMKAKFSRRPIPVDGTGVIFFSIETSKMEVGVFHRVIQVKTSAGVTLLTVQGTMVP